jgi:putative spermidine/putrescine transport system permease protein
MIGSKSVAAAFRQRPAGRRWSPEASAVTGLILAAPFLLFLLAFMIYPLFRLIATAFGEPDGIGNFGRYFDNRAHLIVMRTTFVDSAIVTAITVFVSAFIAWSLRTVKSRVTRLIVLAAIFLPFWMGSVIKLYALTIVLGREGIVNSVLQAIGLTDEPLQLLYTEAAVIIGMVYQMIPYAVLPLLVTFLTIDVDIVQAAESLGATRARALLGIVVPLATPGILATIAITYVFCLGFFLTPVVLGGSRSPFAANLISMDVFQFFDFVSASLSGVLLLVGATIVISLAYLIVGRDRLARALG